MGLGGRMGRDLTAQSFAGPAEARADRPDRNTERNCRRCIVELLPDTEQKHVTVDCPQPAHRVLNGSQLGQIVEMVHYSLGVISLQKVTRKPRNRCSVSRRRPPAVQDASPGDAVEPGQHQPVDEFDRLTLPPRFEKNDRDEIVGEIERAAPTRAIGTNGTGMAVENPSEGVAVSGSRLVPEHCVAGAVIKAGVHVMPIAARARRFHQQVRMFLDQLRPRLRVGQSVG